MLRPQIVLPLMSASLALGLAACVQAGVDPSLDLNGDAQQGDPPDAGQRQRPSTAMLCSLCQSDQACNPNGGSTNFCVADSTGLGACGTECSRQDDCPTGYACYQVVDGQGSLRGRNCFPAGNASCFSIAGPSPDAGVVDSGPSPDSGPNPCPDTWTNYAQTFFSTNCVRCHANYGSFPGVTGSLGRIQGAINAGTMPPQSAGALSAEDLARIDQWFSCNAPQ